MASSLPTRWLVSTAVVVGLFFAVPAVGTAQVPANQGLVVRDGSLGTGPLDVPPGVDPLGQHADYLITPELGERHGRNLFHSFGRFSIGTGETATFTGPDPIDAPQTVENVISRVTGVDASNIDGTLRSTIPGADVYLLNPSGLLFGPNAHLDVQGSFHASTADSLRFDSGEVFEARAGGPIPLLEVAAPQEFGFLSTNGAPIDIEGSLDVPEDRSLAIVGAGEIGVGGSLSVGPGHAELGGAVTIQGGRVEIGTASLQSDRVPVLDAHGGINVQGDRVVVQHDRAIAIRGAEISLGEFSEARAEGGAIVIEGTDDVTIAGILSAGSRTGDAGKVTIRGSGVIAGRIDASANNRLGQGGTILIEGVGDVSIGGVQAASLDGDAGTVTIRGGTVIVEGSVGAHTFGSGSAGTVLIEAAGDVTIAASVAAYNRDGHPGTVTIRGDNVTLHSNTDVRTDSGGSGTAGAILIEATGDLSAGSGSSVAANGLYGNAGAVTLRADNVTLDSSSFVGAIADSEGHGGTILIEGAQDVTIGGSVLVDTSAGEAGSVTVQGGSVTIEESGAIGADASFFSVGSAGTVRISSADDVTISGYLSISGGSTESPPIGGPAISLTAADSIHLSGTIRSDVWGSARGGSIELDASEVRFSPRGFVGSFAYNGSHGSPIAIQADRIALLGDGGVTIRSSAFDASTGGNVTLRGLAMSECSDATSPKDYPLADSIVLNNTTIVTHALGSGRGGAITAAGRDVELHRSGIASQAEPTATSSGRGGNLRVLADQLSMMDSSKIVATTFAAGAGGDVTIDVTGEVDIEGEPFDAPTPPVGFVGTNGVEASTGFGSGPGGSMLIRADHLRLKGAAISVGTNGGGDAGDLTIEVGDLLVGENGQIGTTTSGSGEGGDLRISADRSIHVVPVRPFVDGPDYRAFHGIIAGVGEDNTGGRSGTLELSAPLLLVGAGGIVATSTVGAGDAGDLEIHVDELEVRDGGVIDSGTLGAGAGGRLAIEAEKSVVVEGEGPSGVPSRSRANTVGDGDASGIGIQTHALVVDGGAIAATTLGNFGDGNAGGIDIDAATVNVENGGRIDSSSFSGGDAGSIRIHASEAVTLDGGTISTSTARTGAAGGIDIRAPRIEMANGGEVSSASRNELESVSPFFEDLVEFGFIDQLPEIEGPPEGDGGSVVLTAEEAIRIEDGSLTTTSVGSGRSGSIVVRAGEIEILDHTLVGAQSTGRGDSGSITIDGARWVLLDSSQATTRSQQGAGGNVTVEAGERARLVGSEITASAGGEQPGNVTLSAPEVELAGKTAVAADSTGLGRAGSVGIDAERSVSLAEGSEITAASAQGEGGSVTVLAGERLDVSGDSVIRADVAGGGAGGNVTLKAPIVRLIDGAFVAAESTGPGGAGSVAIEAAQSLVLEGSEITTRAARGRGGNVRLTANEIEIRNGSELGAQSMGLEDAGAIVIDGVGRVFVSGSVVTTQAAQGAGGSVTVRVGQGLDVRGSVITASVAGEKAGGSVRLNAGEAALEGTLVSAESTGLGHAGSVAIETTRWARLSGSTVTTQSATGGGGNIAVRAVDGLDLVGSEITASVGGGATGGNVVLNGDVIELRGGTSVAAESKGAGRAGSVGVEAERSVLIAGGSRITTQSTGGAGGSVTVRAGELLDLSGDSVITAGVGGDMPGGNVTLTAPQVRFTDGAVVKAESTGSDRAGSIAIEAARSLVLEGSRITSQAAHGLGGNVRLDAGEMELAESSVSAGSTEGGGGNVAIRLEDTVHLVGSHLTASVTSGKGGNVSIGPVPNASRPVFVILEGSDITASAGAGGLGGLITITADAFVADASSTLDASAPGGPEFAGTVELNAPDTDFAGEIATLPASLLDASALLRERCSARASGDSSGFVVAGRDGVPAGPEGLLPGLRVTPDGRVTRGDDPSIPSPPLAFLAPGPFLPPASSCAWEVVH